MVLQKYRPIPGTGNLSSSVKSSDRVPSDFYGYGPDAAQQKHDDNGCHQNNQGSGIGCILKNLGVQSGIVQSQKSPINLR
jgi:hypothetical protein